MKLCAADEKSLDEIKNFLLPYEKICVQLCSYVRKAEEKTLERIFILREDCDDSFCSDASDRGDDKAAGNKKTFSRGDDKAGTGVFDKAAGNKKASAKGGLIHGVFYIHGSLLHCIPDFKTHSAGYKQALIPVLTQKLKENQIKCINGEKEASEWIKEILLGLGARSGQTNFYNLMMMDFTDEDYFLIGPEEKLSLDDEIRRCGEENIDELLELQKLYVKEEVAPAGKNPGELEVRLILKQILKNQVCVALYSDLEAVAKANTNAIGWNFVQIGGVYTNPLYRRNGYAWHLIFNLCRRIQKAKKSAVLYVKERNAAAAGLYEKAGFKVCGRFEIAYFE